MIPIIGTMIGLYVITRMLELAVTDRRLYLRILAFLTAAGNLIGIVLLFTGSISLGSDLNATTDTNPSTMSSFMDSVTSATSGLTDGTPSTPSWQLSQSTNPIDDSPSVVLTLPASSGRSRMGEPPTLVLRCSRNQTDVYVNWSDYMGSEEVSVTTRVGKGAARTRTWNTSTDNVATFYPGRPVEFIKELMSVDTLVLRATPYGESPITAVFEVRGLTEKAAPLQAACGWK
jgi:type VI secretion system VasI family protein